MDLDPTGQPKKIEISLVKHNYQDHRGIAEFGLSKAVSGAKVIILRNTVRDAIATQCALENVVGHTNRRRLLFSCQDTVTLHHGRFHPADREMLDQEIVRRFGLEGIGDPGIVVTTQTVEQSLDVDFDFMITDLCPMDVLLQRAGRLHRHTKKRPPGFEEPHMHIVVPEKQLVSFINEHGDVATHAPAGLGRVYENLVILELTLRILRKRKTIEIPIQNRKLVERTLHSQSIKELVDAEKDPGSKTKWRKHRENILGKNLAHKLKARLVFVPRNLGFGTADCQFPSRLDERISTRLGVSDRLVHFKNEEHKYKSPFGNTLSFLGIPGWMVPENFDDIEVEVIEATRGRLEFTCGTGLFVYDRLGLQKLK